MQSRPSVPRIAVSTLGPGRRKLLAATIDTPRDGGLSDAWAIRVSGHMLGESGPVTEIVAVSPRGDLATAMTGLPTPEVAARHPDVPGAEACGFAMLVNTLSLPQRFEFRLRATLTDGSRVEIFSISGERELLTATYEPRLQPLLVTSLGQMGTTLLMQMLSAHPGVIVYDRPPYEAGAGKYWLHVLKALAAGGNPFYSAYSAAVADLPEVAAWSGSTYLTDLAAFCQQSIDGWYLATAAAQGKQEDALVYFAEKHSPDAYSQLARELYPRANELFLVWDVRDMIASMPAYNERKGFGDFGRERATSDAEWLADLPHGVVALRDAWRERGDPVSLVHYEDLVREPKSTLPTLLTFLGLDASPQTVDQLVAAATPDTPELQGHGTAGSPDASITRWQRDLPPELQSTVEERFGDLLQDFGYT